jgi:hypothetical protein
MKHSTLEALAPLLKVLRAHPALHEIRPATFHLKGRNFVHFHEEPEGIFADVLLAKGRVHMPVSTATEQAELLQQIGEVLESLEQRERQRDRGGRRRRRDSHRTQDVSQLGR